ncbi:MAG: DUF6129 family protein [Candidatus Thiodiazotropha sp.]
MINQSQIDQIGDQLLKVALDDTVVGGLRKDFPEIHFTYCMDDDVVSAKPVHEAESFNLYLIDSRNHCLSFTQDLSVATGIVVAEIEAA